MTSTSSLPDWLEVGLLAVNAGFIYWYLRETQRIRKASEAQLEAQIRPALGIKFGEALKLRIVNIGNGPALNVHFVLRDSGVEVDWNAPIEGPQFLGLGGLLAAHDSTDLNVSTAFSGKSLQVVYESLSGSTYASLIDYDHHGNQLRTRLFLK